MKDWLYFLTDETGKSYHINNGLVQTTAQKKPLLYTPDGWQDIAIGWERNIIRIGTVRNFTLPLGFVLDGAQMLRDIMYTKSIEEKIYLLITKLNLIITPTTYQYLYEYFYKGELDLSTLKDDDVKMTVNIMEGGLSKLLKANEATVYEFPMNAPETILVKMDGAGLQNSYKLFLPATDQETGGLQGGTWTMGVYQGAAGSHYGTYIQDVAWADLTGFSNTGDRYFIEALNESREINLTGVISIGIPKDQATPFRVHIETSEGTVIEVVPYTVVDPAGLPGMPPFNSGYVVKEFAINLTFTLKPGERASLLSTGYTPLHYPLDGYLNVNYLYFHPTSYIKAWKPVDLYPEIVGKITGNKNDASSALLATKNHIVYTSGDAIRGLPLAKLKTNLNNFFEDAKVRYGAGLGIEGGKIAIEKYEHFLDETNPIPLGNAKDLKVTLATDLMHNTVKIGYTEKSIDDVNGKYSFNNSHLYSSPLTKIVKELSLISPYVSDPYVIELTRINLEGKTTTDSSKDNEVFVLNVKEVTQKITASLSFLSIGSLQFISVTGADASYDTFQIGEKFTVSGSLYNNKTFTIIAKGVLTTSFTLVVRERVTPETTSITITITTYELNRPAYTTVTGVPDPASIFNIEELTVSRLMRVQEKWLNSIFFHFPGEYFKFQTTEKNADLFTALGTDVFDENANIQIGTTRLFLPFYFEFDTEVPIDLVDLLETNPNRCFSFVWNEQTFTGFLMKAGIAPNTNKEQAFKLLAAPSNNIQNLI